MYQSGLDVQAAEQRGTALLNQIELNISLLDSKNYYSLATYNSCFKQKSFQEFVAHENRLFALRDRFEEGSEYFNRVNNLLIDLQRKCPTFHNARAPLAPILATTSPAA